MDPSTWVHFCSAVEVAEHEAVLANLAAAGLKPDTMHGPAGPYGIVVCHQVDDEVIETVAHASRDARVLVLVAGPARPRASCSLWRVLEAGASDLLTWTNDPAVGHEVLARLERWRAVQELAGSESVAGSLIGTSRCWRALVRHVVEIAAYSQSAVLVVGESGTGKELLARLIHQLDPRRGRRELIVVDCTTISPELSGSEFFGHERGAFTGAACPRDGAFMLANGGTLFLDEIGELPLALQAQLLRVVQEGKYKRLGANQWQHTEFRLVAATNRDLEAAVAAGTFRGDLYQRIAGWVCKTPPLRDRPEDILPLAHHFQAQFSKGKDCAGFDEPVCQYLRDRAYPGNVRDLRRLVARLCDRHAGPGPITMGDVPADERPSSTSMDSSWQTMAFEQAIRRAVDQGIGLKEIGRVAEELAIRFALEHEGNSVPRAAKWLDVNPRTLQLRRAAAR